MSWSIFNGHVQGIPRILMTGARDTVVILIQSVLSRHIKQCRKNKPTFAGYLAVIINDSGRLNLILKKIWSKGSILFLSTRPISNFLHRMIFRTFRLNYIAWIHSSGTGRCAFNDFDSLKVSDWISFFWDGKRCIQRSVIFHTSTSRIRYNHWIGFDDKEHLEHLKIHPMRLQISKLWVFISPLITNIY